MTDDRLPTEWTDDRLAGAFAARSAARPTPSDLVPATIDRLRAEPRPVRARFGFAHLGGAAAAAVVLAVVAVGVFGPRPTTEPGDPNTGTFGLEPVTVGEAIAIRDAGVDDRELAVSGYYVTAGPIRCLSDGSNNPTRPWCPSLLSWLMERPEVIDVPAVRSSGATPAGPAIQSPGLALVDASELAAAAGVVVPVTFIGHFDDRRAASCTADERNSCTDTFVVDRIAEIDGRVLETGTLRDLAIEVNGRLTDVEPARTEAAVDAIVRQIDPTLRILSRRVMLEERLGATEPAYAASVSGTEPSFGSLVPELVWTVVTLPPVDAGGRAIARTFVIRDAGVEPVVEITRDGAFPVSATATPSPTPAATPSATLPSEAWTWPEAVLGLPVISVADVRNRLGEFDDTELAIRGWYVPLDDPIRCPPRGVSLRPPEITCPLGTEWLLQDPQLLEDPVSHERRPPSGPALNPVIDPSIPFDIPVGWFDRGPEPLPVVVLAHFGDSRAQSYLEAERLVVDALVWRAGADAAQDPVLLTAATSTPAEIAALVESKTGPARANWIAVVTGARVVETGSHVTSFAPELGESDATWTVRRLVEEAGRPVVRSAYVVDGTDRVWDEAWAGTIQLATTLDVTAGQSAVTGAVVAQVADTSRLLTGVRAATDADLSGATFFERPVPPGMGTISLSVASVPGSDREILIVWVGGACDEAWRVDVSAYAELGGILVSPRRIVPEAPCDGRAIGIRRSVVLEFAAPTSAESIEANTNPSGG